MKAIKLFFRRNPLSRSRARKKNYALTDVQTTSAQKWSDKRQKSCRICCEDCWSAYDNFLGLKYYRINLTKFVLTEAEWGFLCFSRETLPDQLNTFKFFPLLSLRSPDSLEQRNLVPVFSRLFAMFHKCYGRRTRGGTAWEIGWRNLDPALFRVEVLQHVNEKVKLDLLAETCSKLFVFCWTWNNYLFQGEQNGDI